jgi:hypothetical protein
VDTKGRPTAPYQRGRFVFPLTLFGGSGGVGAPSGKFVPFGLLSSITTHPTLSVVMVLIISLLLIREMVMIVCPWVLLVIQGLASISRVCVLSGSARLLFLQIKLARSMIPVSGGEGLAQTLPRNRWDCVLFRLLPFLLRPLMLLFLPHGSMLTRTRCTPP